MTLLAINWGSVGLQAAQLLVSLSILVVLHEFGHYITAKWFKCRVEKFYLFFDPWFSLFKKKVGETEYGVGWLPLGGYVKISGMIDESMDKEAMKEPPKPYEFRSKPAWQRLIIMIGGVTVNVLLAFIIYAGILMVWGEKTVPISTMKYGMSFNDSIFADLKFQNGDRILAVDGKPVEDLKGALRKLLIADSSVTVFRNGQEVTFKTPKNLIGKLVEKKKFADAPLISARSLPYVDFVPDTSVAYKNGLRHGDYITGINDKPITFFDEVRSTLAASKPNEQITLDVKRGDSVLHLTTKLDEKRKIGFVTILEPERLDSMGIIVYKVQKYSFFKAIPAGVRKAGDELQYYIDQFKKILQPSSEAYKGVGGFKAMGSVFSGVSWDWEHFWTMTAFFSIVLAFMNMLPIPALDGGHVLFTLIEMITGRKPNEKFLEYAQIVGMVILLALMLYANGNDWFGWGKGK